jgi:multisubunit Na+/H+ antiporter MnhF subunit
MIKSWSRVFTAFIGDGYIASAFFAACAFLYFDPIANGKLAFAIVMCVLLMIILLIATNIPMYRLFEGKETTEQLVGLSLTAAIGLGLVAIMNFAALICCMIVTKNTTMTYGDNISIQLAVAAVTNLIACGFDDRFRRRDWQKRLGRQKGRCARRLFLERRFLLRWGGFVERRNDGPRLARG